MVRARLHKCTRPRPSALPTFSYSVAPANGLVEGEVFSAHRSDRTVRFEKVDFPQWKSTFRRS